MGQVIRSARGGLGAVLLTPPEPDGTLVYLCAKPEAAQAAWALLPAPPALAVIDAPDWSAAFSPWPAEKVLRGSGDFTGDADTTLQLLLRDIVPELERTLEFPVKKRCLAGYSMGGLFAVYAAFRCGAFDRIASVSGSLWFDGFSDYTAAHEFFRSPERAVFSLGSREKHTANPRMACVERSTLAVAELFRRRGTDTRYFSEPGSHFSDVPGRISRALQALLTDES